MLKGAHFVDKAFEPLELDHQKLREFPHAYLFLIRRVLTTFETVKLSDTWLILQSIIGFIGLLEVVY